MNTKHNWLCRKKDSISSNTEVFRKAPDLSKFQSNKNKNGSKPNGSKIEDELELFYSDLEEVLNGDTETKETDKEAEDMAENIGIKTSLFIKEDNAEKVEMEIDGIDEVQNIKLESSTEKYNTFDSEIEDTIMAEADSNEIIIVNQKDENKTATENLQVLKPAVKKETEFIADIIKSEDVSNEDVLTVNASETINIKIEAQKIELDEVDKIEQEEVVESKTNVTEMFAINDQNEIEPYKISFICKHEKKSTREEDQPKEENSEQHWLNEAIEQQHLEQPKLEYEKEIGEFQKTNKENLREKDSNTFKVTHLLKDVDKNIEIQNKQNDDDDVVCVLKNTELKKNKYDNLINEDAKIIRLDSDDEVVNVIATATEISSKSPDKPISKQKDTEISKQQFSTSEHNQHCVLTDQLSFVPNTHTDENVENNNFVHTEFHSVQFSTSEHNQHCVLTDQLSFVPNTHTDENVDNNNFVHTEFHSFSNHALNVDSCNLLQKSQALIENTLKIRNEEGIIGIECERLDSLSNECNLQKISDDKNKKAGSNIEIPHAKRLRLSNDVEYNKEFRIELNIQQFSATDQIEKCKKSNDLKSKEDVKEVAGILATDIQTTNLKRAFFKTIESVSKNNSEHEKFTENVLKKLRKSSQETSPQTSIEISKEIESEKSTLNTSKNTNVNSEENLVQTKQSKEEKLKELLEENNLNVVKTAPVQTVPSNNHIPLYPPPKFKEQPTKLSLDFFQRFHKTYNQMTRNNLEELVLQKIVEAILYENEFAELRLIIEKQEKLIEQHHLKLEKLVRKYHDLKILHKHVIKDMQEKNSNSLQPIRKTRTVGLQVNSLKNDSLAQILVSKNVTLSTNEPLNFLTSDDKNTNSLKQKENRYRESVQIVEIEESSVDKNSSLLKQKENRYRESAEVVEIVESSDGKNTNSLKQKEKQYRESAQVAEIEESSVDKHRNLLKQKEKQNRESAQVIKIDESSVDKYRNSLKQEENEYRESAQVVAIEESSVDKNTNSLKQIEKQYRESAQVVEIEDLGVYKYRNSLKQKENRYQETAQVVEIEASSDDKNTNSLKQIEKKYRESAQVIEIDESSVDKYRNSLKQEENEYRKSAQVVAIDESSDDKNTNSLKQIGKQYRESVQVVTIKESSVDKYRNSLKQQENQFRESAQFVEIEESASSKLSFTPSANHNIEQKTRASRLIKNPFAMASITCQGSDLMCPFQKTSADTFYELDKSKEEGVPEKNAQFLQKTQKPTNSPILTLLLNNPPKVFNNGIQNEMANKSQKHRHNSIASDPRHNTDGEIPVIDLTGKNDISLSLPSTQPLPHVSEVTSLSKNLSKKLSMTSITAKNLTHRSTNKLNDNVMRFATQRPHYNHPAPLPPASQQTFYAGCKLPPPRPTISVTKLFDGIEISWIIEKPLDRYANITSYQIYAYHVSEEPPSVDSWKNIGFVKAVLLPMAVALTQFQKNERYFFAVRAVDMFQRYGPFSDPKTWD